ncbi:MAG: hypothetical protein ACYC6L_10145 [Anaerolineae bacterium]
MSDPSRKYTVQLDERELRIIVELMRFSLDYCPIQGICPELNVTADDIETIMTRLESELNSG